MSIEDNFKLMAENKARTDFQDNREAFLSDDIDTNGYSKVDDLYMREAYERVRSEIIKELEA